MKVYLAGSIAHANEQFQAQFNQIKSGLQSKYEILDYFGFKPDEDPRVIYRHDADCVKKCDALIGECSIPSTGVGYEIGLALSLDKPVIVLAKGDAIVSAMLIGNPVIKFIRYQNAQEAIDRINQILSP